MFDYKNRSYSCESGECEFDPEEQEPTTKNDLGVEHHKQNIQAYAHDFGVSEEQAEKELRVTTKNDLGVDCISRADAIRVASGYCHPSNVAKELAKLPSVTPQEPKTGHWKPYLKEGLRYQCSVCDSRFDTPWEYCPHCGAKMAETEADNGDD